MLSKFKNIFKVFKSKLFIIGVLCKIAIFFPCFVYGYPLFGSQIVSENLKDNQMRSDIMSLQILPNIRSITTARADVVFQKIKLNDKGVSKFSGSLIKILSVDKTGRKIITNEATNKNANDCKTTADQCYFIGNRTQFWLSLFMGGFLGIVMGVLILNFIFWFVLRRLK